MHNTDTIHHHYILAKFNTYNTSDNTSLNTSWLVSLHLSASHHGCSIHPAKSQYIQYILPWTWNTANSTSCKFSIHLNTSPVPQLIHPGAIINTSFNTSCQDNNTSNTSFNTLEYILPFFNTSDVLDDYTSNTSFDTSQYILPIFLYIPIHPACIGMYWMLIHPQYIPGDLLMIAMKSGTVLVFKHHHIPVPYT
jgi:hypothetical protein